MDDQQRAREAFEAWHCEKFKTQWQTGAPTRDMHNGVYDENYGPPAQQDRWELWQAAYAAALRSAPVGFALVPVEPTEEMVDASMIRVELGKRCGPGTLKVLGARAWAAMLAARQEVSGG